MNTVFNKDYFKNRNCNDDKRMLAFESEFEISDHAKSVAKKNGVKFNKHLFNSKDYFSTIVFRGTIQHVDTPFLYMKKAYESLKKGGKVVFLATPNANSLYFKLWSRFTDSSV